MINNSKYLALLRAGMPIKRKVSVVKSILSSPEDANELMAILTLAQSNNWSSQALNALREHLTIVDTLSPTTEVKNLYDELKVTGTTSGIVSETAFELLSYLLSPLASGFTRDSLDFLLKDEFLTAKEAHEVLNLKFVKPKEAILTPCGCCGRVMKSTKDSTGLCASCTQIVISFTTSRRGEFFVPITLGNFPRLLKANNKSIQLQVLDYKITKGDGVVLFTHFNKVEEPLYLPLPFEEFTKEIVF